VNALKNLKDWAISIKVDKIMEWKIIEEINKQMATRMRKHYIIECSCGYQRTVMTSEWKRFLEDKNTAHLNKKCQKCLSKDRVDRLSYKDAYEQIYSANKRQAERAGKIFTISLEESINLYKDNCFYCNTAPSNRHQIRHAKRFFNYSGIDRIDSSMGYENGNVVSCCFNCNRAKSNLGQKEFIDLISKIYINRVQRLSEAGVEPSGSK
jgi:hypothetical protein